MHVTHSSRLRYFLFIFALFFYFSGGITTSAQKGIQPEHRGVDKREQGFTILNPTVFINEIHYDNASTDSGEGVEVAGPAGTSLAGWKIVHYNGAGGGIISTTNLSGSIPDFGGGCGAVWFAISGLQNGPDGVALIDDLSQVMQFLSYEGVFTATAGDANGLTSTDMGVNETTSTPVGESLQLTGTGAVYTDFSWASPATATIDAANNGQTFSCAPPGPPAQAALGEVVINEFLPNSAVTEWVELYNTTGMPLDIGGFYIDDVAGGGATPLMIPISTTIAANGFYTMDMSGVFADAGSGIIDDVRFLSPSMAEYDFTDYGTTTPDFSWYRVTDGGSWSATDTASTTKNASNVILGGPVSPGDIVINEFVPNSATEWVELYNTTNMVFDIGGYWIDDIAGGGSAPKQIPGGTMIGPNDFYVLTFSSVLNNGGDDVRFLDPGQTVELDLFTYTSSTAEESYVRCPDGGAWNLTMTAATTAGVSNPCAGTTPWVPGEFRIYVLDVEQGDSQLVIFPSGFSILIDAAEKSWNSGKGATLVASKIQAITGGTHVNVAVLSHLHLDHIGYAGYGGMWGLIENHGITFDKVVDRDAGYWSDGSGGGANDGLCDKDLEIVWNNAGTQSGTARTWLCYSTNPANANIFGWREVATPGTTQIAPPDAGAIVEIVQVDALGVMMADGVTPLQGDHTLSAVPPSENDYSIGIKITYGDIVYATAGDSDGEYDTSSWGYSYNDIETGLADAFCEVDLMRANHHGSGHSTSQYYVDRLNPDASMISCGNNSYGHPAQAVLDRLKNTSDVYLTNVCSPTPSYAGVVTLDGDIEVVSTDGTNYTVFDGTSNIPYTARTPKGCAVPPSVDSTTPSGNEANVPLAANIDIAFTEPVNVSGSWFTISCSLSGAHTAVVTGVNPSGTYSLDPDTDFVADDVCTVTLMQPDVVADASGMNLTSNYAWTFTAVPSPSLSCGSGAIDFIFDVQGSGPISPMDTQLVVIEGIVVGDFQGGGGLSGFYMQEEDGDADGNVLTSDGVFVYDPGSTFNVREGDYVRVAGTVTEYFGMTEITSVTEVSFCGNGFTVTPATVNLPIPNLADWEQYEGMLINVPQEVTVTGNFFWGRFGQLDVAVNGRLYNPTQIVAPGAAAVAQKDINDRSRFILDDGSSAVPNLPPYIDADGTRRGGSTIPSVTGVVEYAFNNWVVHPTVAPVFTNPTPRPTTPPSTGLTATLQIASLNLYNFFNGNGTAQVGAAGGWPSARGATTLTEFNRQKDKTALAIATMNVDILALMELENDYNLVGSEYIAAEELVDAINAIAGAGTYAFIDPGGLVGTDVIATGYLYKPATVTPIGASVTIPIGNQPNKNRQPLAQTFEEVATGEQFNIIVNHLKSKGSCPALGTDALNEDSGDGQGCWNDVRLSGAQDVMTWANANPTGVPITRTFIMGDMNAYALEDPISEFSANGYTNIIEMLQGLTTYSYVFAGEHGTLDYLFGNAAAMSTVVGADDWHINADEPVSLDYNQEFNQPILYKVDEFRVSDHDPALLGICLSPSACGAPCSVPTAPTLATVTEAGFNAMLDWADVVDANGYEIHRSTMPFVSPVPATLFATSVTSDYPDNGAIGSAVDNYYYYIVATKGCGSFSTPSNHVGEFDFTIVPGL